MRKMWIALQSLALLLLSLNDQSRAEKINIEISKETVNNFVSVTIVKKKKATNCCEWVRMNKKCQKKFICNIQYQKNVLACLRQEVEVAKKILCLHALGNEAKMKVPSDQEKLARKLCLCKKYMNRLSNSFMTYLHIFHYHQEGGISQLQLLSCLKSNSVQEICIHNVVSE